MSRNYQNSNSKGSYRLIVRPKKTVLDPGNHLAVHVYISGCGAISQAKLVTNTETDLFDECFVSSEFALRNDELIQGATRKSVQASFTMLLNAKGLNKNGTVAFDSFSPPPNTDIPFLLSELEFPAPPVGLDYRLKENSPAGTYKLSCVLTYFDGSGWATDRVEFEFTIRSVFQRREFALAKLAFFAGWATVIATLATIVGMAYTIASYYKDPGSSGNPLVETRPSPPSSRESPEPSTAPPGGS